MYALEKEKTQQHKNTNTLTLRGGGTGFNCLYYSPCADIFTD